MPVKPAPTADRIRSGSIRIPASTGEKEFTIWNLWGRLMSVTRNGKPDRSAVLFVEHNQQLLKI
jgi:hypothetical protein